MSQFKWGIRPTKLGVQIGYKGPMGFAFGRALGRGGVLFIATLALRWRTVLLLNLGMILSVEDLLYRRFSLSCMALLDIGMHQWQS